MHPAYRITIAIFLAIASFVWLACSQLYLWEFQPFLHTVSWLMFLTLLPASSYMLFEPAGFNRCWKAVTK